MQNISFKDFYKPTPYNEETKNQIWMSQIADSHDNICDCLHPFAHLLASIFPPGHQDRDLSINQILFRDYTQKCLSGGREDKRDGMADNLDGEEEENSTDQKENIKEEDTDALFAAAVENFER